MNRYLGTYVKNKTALIQWFKALGRSRNLTTKLWEGGIVVDMIGELMNLNYCEIMQIKRNTRDLLSYQELELVIFDNSTLTLLEIETFGELYLNVIYPPMIKPKLSLHSKLWITSGIILSVMAIGSIIYQSKNSSK